uniref:cysteine dioxygenase n=1 Tax=Oryza sativa subsp. japonica TaxID=39947 RepID=Q8W393_ORYSJ|nr:putative kinase [Oryza sativa Japonica Group]
MAAVSTAFIFGPVLFFWSSACIAAAGNSDGTRLRLHRRPASVAAEWCLRLHGWPIMPPLLGVYDFTAGLPPSPPSGASAYTAGLLCRCCWASTTSPPACLRCRRVVPPPTRLAYYAAAVRRLRLHRRPASVAAEWCLRLHGWPIMPLLLGVNGFTAGLPLLPPSGASAYTAGLLCRRCWASTTSPPACLRRRRLVPPPTRLAYYAADVGRLRLHRRPASIAADWCPRLYGWLVTPPFMGVHVFADRLAFAAADWCFCLYGWRTSPLLMGFIIYTTGLVPLAPTGMDQSEHHHRLASTTADWCFRLHGWPIMPPLLGVYVFIDRLAFAAADWCFCLHGWPIMPPLLGVYIFTDRPPRPPPTDLNWVGNCCLCLHSIKMYG